MDEFYRLVDSFFAALPDPVYLLDTSGRVRRVNESALALISEVGEGSTIQDLAWALEWGEAETCFKQCVAHDKSLFRVLKNETDQALFEVTFVPMHYAGDEIDAVWISMVNVAGEALRDERYSMLDRVFNSIGEGVLTLDLRGRITGMNRSAASLLGVKEEDIHPEIWDRVLQIPDAHARAVLWKTFENLERTELSTEVVLPDGSSLPCSLSLSPLDGEDMSCMGFAVIIKDLTAQMEMERSLFQMEKLNSLGKLVAGFAHELNNPLTSVIGFAQLLLGNRQESAVHEEVSVIHSHALRCKKIIDNLLTFARESVPEKKALDLNDAVRNTVDLLEYQMEREKIRVTLELERDLPRVKADPSQIQQVLVNLMENCRYELCRKEGSRRIEIATVRDREEAMIRIADNGPGIPSHCLDRIFDPFFTTKPIGEGTGLGLSLSFGIVQEHGGRLIVSNAPSGGAVFEIRLPVAPATSRKDRRPKKKQEKEAPSFGDQEPRVLIVDDESEVCRLVKKVLAGQGMRVTSAANGKKAIEVMRRRAFDLVLLDIRLPDINGLDLKADVLAKWPEYENRILFITGDVVDGEGAPSKVLEGDEDLLITKPFNVEVLKSKVVAALTINMR
jgi:two-component system NtrC family sensor kinase